MCIRDRPGSLPVDKLNSVKFIFRLLCNKLITINPIKIFKVNTINAVFISIPLNKTNMFQPYFTNVLCYDKEKSA